MRMNGKSRGLFLAAVFCAAVPASATTLTIVNPSFEAPVAVGGIQTGATGWDILGPNTDSGVWNIKDFPMGYWNTPVLGLDGKQVAYLASSFSPAGGGLAQTLSCTNCTFDPGFTYTLTGLVGVPKQTSSTTPAPHYRISLWAGSTILGSVSGTGPERTLEHFAPLEIDGSAFADLGGQRQQLRIELFSDGPQTAIDALVLEATAAVPEPASAALFALGIGLLAFTLRVRDKRQIAA